MSIVVKKVSHEVINQYLESNIEPVIHPWDEAVQDKDTVTTLLTKPSFKKGRSGYGLFVDGKMVGYAIVWSPAGVLDLLHIAKTHRGKGLGEKFLRQLPVKEVVVDENNTAAVKLYKKLGLVIDYALEGYSYAP